MSVEVTYQFTVGIWRLGTGREECLCSLINIMNQLSSVGAETSA